VRALYAYIYSRVGNREAAEALTTAVAMAALLDGASQPEEREAEGWMDAAARAAAASYWRPGRRRDDPTGADQDTAAGEHQEGDRATRAASLLARLPEPERSALSCRLLDGLSVAETARHLGTDEATVKALQYRALARAARLRQEETRP
jgi:RNA polymerase sigma-70 factor (ECF subfamily)